MAAIWKSIDNAVTGDNDTSTTIVLLFIISTICGILFILSCFISYRDNLLSYDFKQIFPKINLLYFALICLITGEIIFWLDDSKPKQKQSVIGFTIEHKIVCLALSFALFGLPALIISTLQRFPKETGGALGVIINFISMIAPYVIGAIVLIYLNSIKFRRKKGM